MFDLSGRVALVTGASSGLGRHFAQTLARAGASVALAARRLDRLEALAKTIAEEGGRAAAIVLDVTDTASVPLAFDAAEAALGPVDVLVNNSGVARTSRVLELEERDWDFVLDTNLKGAWLVAQECARRMVSAGRGGTIVNIVSITAFRVAGGLAAYAASKAALAQLTRAMALELARDGVRVNALAPGYVRTEINQDFFDSPAGEAMIRRVPQRRIGEPEDLDGALLLLASDASRYMTGSIITVDGGHLQSSL
jgi:NAD(P)-dependent dehydrogenase (short-subunit alcohol dehydrogenase family)